MTSVKVETTDDVAVVTMANPPANLFNRELMAGLREVFRGAKLDGARAMVLRSDGALFCGGADVEMFKGTSPAEARSMFAEGFELIEAIEEAPFPVIAAVQGLCLAAGLEAATFERWNIVNRVVPAGELDARALQWARRLAAGPTPAHAVTKRLVHHATDQGVRETDRYLLDAATPLFASRDLQHAVNLLLAQGAREFMARHDEVVFEGH